KQDVPPWYEALDEPGRWNAQAKLWETIAAVCADSPAVFCYDLMNEPLVPAGKVTTGWLAPVPLAGFYYVQYISLDQRDRPRPQIAREWIRCLSTAIRKHDRRHLVTVGLLPNSLKTSKFASGFEPEEVAPELD